MKIGYQRLAIATKGENPMSTPYLTTPSGIDIYESAARRWVSMALLGLCAFSSNLAQADTPASAVPPAQGTPVPLKLPEVPDTTPSPWMPDAIERSMGAKCEGPSGKGQNWEASCSGPMPAHLARMIEAMPDDLFDKNLAPAALRHKALTTEPWDYSVAPGQGQRSDFLILIGGVIIKTLEGPDPNVTIVAVLRPCKPKAACYVLPDPRLFRFADKAPPQDVTDTLWPGQPAITPRQEAYLNRHDAGDPFIFLDVSKLAYAPTVRWGIEFDPHGWPSSKAPLPRGWSAGHMGFVTWTGTRFEKRLTVPRRLWPCWPVPKGSAPCSRDTRDNANVNYQFPKYVTP
jgi:hypothetical protein